MPGDGRIQRLYRDITVPAEAGDVVERRLPAGEPTGLIVLVQNMPANYGVQINTARILDALITQYGFEIVCVDGTDQRPSYGILRDLPGFARRWYSARLLKRGLTNGPLHLAVTKPQLPFEVQGIESAQWYEANFTAAHEGVRHREEAVSLMCTFEQALLKCCVARLSPDFRVLVEARQAYVQSEDADPQSAPIQPQPSELTRWSAANSRALQAFVRQLHLYANVTGLLTEADDEVRIYLDGYRNAGGGVPGFDGDRPLSCSLASHQLTLRVLGELAESAEDRASLFLLTLVDVGRRALQMRLLSAEADAFLALMADDVDEKMHDAVAQLREGQPASDVLQIPERLRELLDVAVDYYHAATMRSSVLASNAVAQLRRRHLTTGILWVSGFHSTHCVATLRRRYGLATVVVMPQVALFDHQPLFDKRITEHSARRSSGMHESPMPWWMSDTLVLPAIWGRSVHAWRRHAVSWHATEVVDAAGIVAPDACVLVLGCRNSSVLPELATRVPHGQVVGQDRFDHLFLDDVHLGSTQRLIDRTGVSARVSLLRCDCRTTPFADDTFDAVVALAIDDIFNIGERIAAWRDWIRVLKPGGSLTIVVHSARYLELAAKVCAEAGMDHAAPFTLGRAMRALWCLGARRPSDDTVVRPSLRINLVDRLRCPASSQPLRLMTASELAHANDTIRQHKLRYRDGRRPPLLAQALITADETAIYPIRSQVITLEPFEQIVSTEPEHRSPGHYSPERRPARPSKLLRN